MANGTVNVTETVSLGRVRQVLTGRVEVLVRQDVLSGIAKRAMQQQVMLSASGLVGDEQADRAVHGGLDKAVHMYSWTHYAAWRQELPACDLLNDSGAFGENLSVVGLDETSVCIADRLRIGSSELEVSQGRQPCWKLNLRFGIKNMSARVQHSLRAGWYCRVVQPGAVTAGDGIELLIRPHPQWTIARLLALIRDRECSTAVLGEVFALPLTPSWRKLFQSRLDLGGAENWEPRMRG